jgi:hypothetical protein
VGRSVVTFTIGSVTRHFRSCGFQTVALTRQFVLPLSLHRWLDNPRLSSLLENLCGAVGLRVLGGAPVTVKAERGAGSRCQEGEGGGP